jgi:hypothetical protein
MSTRRVATLRTRLRGFAEADTSSEREGYVAPGDYAVLETATSLAGAADYARVALSRGGDTWICTRSGTASYATIHEVPLPPPAPRVSFVDDAKAIDEHALTSLFAAFHEYSYDLDEGHYPWPLPTARVPLAPPRQNNCCTFVEALVAKAFAGVDGFRWDARRHGQMMVDSDDDYFSPVTALVDSGIAVPAPSPDASPHPWTVVQGWRRMWRQGHTFIVVDHHAPTDRVLILESNAAYGLNGPGYRELGALRLHANGAPAQWWENDASWTWTRVCSTYRFRQQAFLRVKNRALAAMPLA